MSAPRPPENAGNARANLRGAWQDLLQRVQQMIVERTPFVRDNKLDLNSPHIVGTVPPSRGGSGTNTGAEPALGNPSADGDVLSSTTAGVRSWITPAGAAALDDLTDVTITTPADADVLTYDSSTSTWLNQAPASALTNPMTTADDVIIGGSSGTPTRLAKGSNNTVLGVDGSGALGYKADPSGGGGGGQELAYVSVTTSTITTTSTTLVDLTGASITATVGSRPIRLTLYVEGVDTNATGDPRLEFSLVDVTAGAEIGGALVSGGIGGSTAAHLAVRLAPAAGSRTWKVQWRTFNPGTGRVLASATRPCYLLVEEL